MTTATKTAMPPSGALAMLRHLKWSGGSVHMTRVGLAGWPATLADLRERGRRFFAIQSKARGGWTVFSDGRIAGHQSERQGLRGDDLAEAVFAELERASAAVESCGVWWRPTV